jgi:hypothetical protein
MGGYSIASMLWTDCAAASTTGEMEISRQGWPKGSGTSLFSAPIEVSKQGFQGAQGHLSPWPKRLWVDMSFTVGSLRAPVSGIRASFAILVNGSAVASAEFMSTTNDHRGGVSCRFARIYDGEPDGSFFGGNDVAIDLRAGWNAAGVQSNFFIERSDLATTDLIVSISAYRQLHSRVRS